LRRLKSSRGEEDQRDLDLLQRVATRDRVAFESLYAKYHPVLSRYLSRIVRRPEMVEEVVSDTLFVVWQKAEQFQGRSKVSTWITGIAYLKGIKAIDRLRLQPEQQVAYPSDVETMEETASLIERLGLSEWLAEGLDAISADQRSVIELTYFNGHSYNEIAEIMDCPVNTVKTRMFHARRRLAKLLPQLSAGDMVVTGDNVPDHAATEEETSPETKPKRLKGEHTGHRQHED